VSDKNPQAAEGCGHPNQPAGEVLKPEEWNDEKIWALVKAMLPPALFFLELESHLQDARERAAAKLKEALALSRPLPQGERAVALQGRALTLALADAISARNEAFKRAQTVLSRDFGIDGEEENGGLIEAVLKAVSYDELLAALTRPASDTGWQIPKGWKLVPEKITPEIAQKLESNYAKCLPPSAVHAANWQEAWAEALAASPAPPTQEDGR
jgi:hypothetical protein